MRAWDNLISDEVLNDLVEPTGPMAPEPIASDLILYSRFQAAFEAVVAGVRQGRLVVLIGQPGVGKTALLRLTGQTFAQMGRSVVRWPAQEHIFDPAAPVLVDDAHMVEPRTLRKVMRRPGGCVFAAPHPPLPPRFGIWSRGQTVTLPPLSTADLPDFVARLSQQTGHGKAEFLASAIAALDRYGEGKPGRISGLARMALFVARMDGGTLVDLVHVERAARLGDDAGDPATPQSPARLADQAQRHGRAPALAWQPSLFLLTMIAGLTLLPNPHIAGPRQARIPAVQVPAPAAVAPPPLLVPLSTAVKLRATIVLEAGRPEAQSQAERIARILDGCGVSAVLTYTAAIRTARAELHYFFVEDEPALAPVAMALGSEIDAVSIKPTGDRTLWRPGAIEIVLPAVPPMAGRVKHG